MGRWRGKETADAVAEKVIGENTLRDIFTLEVLLDLSRAVARIDAPTGLGTGFLISDDLLMTNNHVIATAADAAKCTFAFNYQLDRRGRAVPVHTSRARSEGLFHTSPAAPDNASRDELDYTVVQLENLPAGIAPLTLKGGAIRRDSRLAIIQHPGGDYKKISLQNNFVEYIDEHVVQYTSTTQPGSSGSPVFGDDFEAVAIHHTGGNLSEPATKRRYLRNEGVRMSAILDDLRRNAPAIHQRLAG
jgi:V8-like Glu-specific endopeptidase